MCGNIGARGTAFFHLKSIPHAEMRRADTPSAMKFGPSWLVDVYGSVSFNIFGQSWQYQQFESCRDVAIYPNRRHDAPVGVELDDRVNNQYVESFFNTKFLMHIQSLSQLI